ncbi:hypothetical protein LINPERPRIM_LOCUS30091 [Linum perenne]
MRSAAASYSSKDSSSPSSSHHYHLLVRNGGGSQGQCRTSVVLVWLVQVKLYRYWNVEMQLQKQRVEGRYVTRLIQELRMKGGSFELGKDPYCGRKKKSSSTET